MKRVVILVNKDFEYAGFIEGLRDCNVPVHAGLNGRQAECRFDHLVADIYCIQNLFKEGENSSNSEVKYGYLTDLFKSNAFRLEDVDAVLSVSSAESTPLGQGDGDESRNGCVYVGNKFFLSDQHENDPTTQSHLPIGKEVSSYTEFYDSEIVIPSLYDTIDGYNVHFKKAPTNPDENPMCLAGSSFVSVGVVNVMDYARYRIADETAYDQSLKMMPDKFMLTIETTHGVVVKALNDVCRDLERNSIPVTFISPIVDRYLKFDDDVDGKYGKQNFVCSYNSGMTTGHILKVLNMEFYGRH